MLARSISFLAVLCSSAALAQSPLAGPPAKSADSDKPTIVRHDFDGKVQRTEQPPEEAVLGLLKIDKATRARIDALLAERARLLEKFVGENLLLLNELQTATAAGDEPGKLRLFTEGLAKLQPLMSKGTLEGTIRDALPKDLRTDFDRLLKDYWDAVYTEKVQDAARTGAKEAGRFGALAEERLKVFGKEIEGAFYRILQSGEIIYFAIAKDLELTPEQDFKLKAILEQFASEVKDQPTPAQVLKVTFAVITVLDGPQAEKLGNRLRELGLLPKKKDPKADDATKGKEPKGYKKPSSKG